MIQATVKDPNEPVGNGTKCLMMGLTALAERVVVVPHAGRAGQGAKGPLVAGIGEPSIAAPRLLLR